MRLVRLERQQSRVADDIRAALASLGRGGTVIGGIALVGVGGVADRPIEAVVLLPHGVIIVIGVDLPDPALRLEAPLGGPWKADGWPLVADDDSVNPATEALDISQACEKRIAALVPGTAPVGTIIAVGPYVETVDQPAADLAGPVRVLHPTPTTMLAATVSLATAHRPRSVDQVRALIRGLAPSAPELPDEVLLGEGFGRMTDDSPPESLWDDPAAAASGSPAIAAVSAATDWRTEPPVEAAPEPAGGVAAEVSAEAASAGGGTEVLSPADSSAGSPGAENPAADLVEVVAPEKSTEPADSSPQLVGAPPVEEAGHTEVLPAAGVPSQPADASAQPVFPGTETAEPPESSAAEAEPNESSGTETERTENLRLPSPNSEPAEAPAAETNRAPEPAAPPTAEAQPAGPPSAASTRAEAATPYPATEAERTENLRLPSPNSEPAEAPATEAEPERPAEPEPPQAKPRPSPYPKPTRPTPHPTEPEPPQDSPQPFPHPRPASEPEPASRTVRWLPLAAIGALALLVVAAVVVATSGGRTDAAPAPPPPPPVTAKAAPPPAAPVRSLQFALRAAAEDQRCASHAFGDAQASLQRTSCSGVQRASYAATVDGRSGAVTVGVVAFPDAAQAAAFKAVADTPGGGGILDLATETAQWGATPAPRFENAAYASKLDGSSVRIVQAVWAPGPSTADDPGLARAAKAALDLPAH
ncbi:hypothetical protein [Amycolatopsis sp. lyj-23]|uniref:hypothetical protein n=1 Tax=Amycolatopsis sp. lyj-23 TaxID=2789283 RepID=UPI0039798000